LCVGNDKEVGDTQTLAFHLPLVGSEEECIGVVGASGLTPTSTEGKGKPDGFWTSPSVEASGTLDLLAVALWRLLCSASSVSVRE
jgi:hypothetical protein